MHGAGVAVAALALAAVLTGCGAGDDRSGTTAGSATASAREAGKRGGEKVEDELTAATVRSDFRMAASSAAGAGPLRFLDLGESAHPCRVWGISRTDGMLERKAVAPLLTVLKQRGWRVRNALPVEERGSFGWILEKNRWEVFLAVGEAPEGAGIVFDSSGTACGVPLPSKPATLEPPERPTPPAPH